ncbi:MAG: AraC family transcriptional regulator [Victivallaceae bacterium]|nr:AraC family transcriptional regulator [Victivallaceae bacterium]
MISGCGYQCETSHNYRWHGMNRGRQELAIWQYTISGNGMIDYNGKLTPVTPGSAMMLSLPHNHCYFLPADSDHWEFIYINFNGRELLRIWHELNRIIGPVAQFKPNSPAVKIAFDIFQSAAAGKITSPLQASSLAYQMVMNIAEELLPQKGSKGHTPQTIIKTIDYCLENLHEPITIEDMAKISGYSRYHFSRLFKASQGISPANFIRDLRLQRAIRLLQSEMISVKEIADRCGFSNDNYFCKVFRQAFGISPNAYRNGGKTLDIRR